MLPYKTMEEAESALNRTLTYAETIWYNYSVNQSDFILHCHNIIFLYTIFTVIPLPLVLVELLGGDKIARYKIQPKVRLSFAQIITCYKDVMKLFFIVAVPIQLISYPVNKLMGIRTGLPLPSGWEIMIQLIVYMVVEDYINYWLHRLLHYFKWCYKNIHKVHHNYPAPIGFSAPNSHWSEILILGSPSLLGPAIAPCHAITFWLWMVLRQVEAIDAHCGYDFPWMPTKYIPFYGGAEFHDYHHCVGGQSRSNFASFFTYCDYIHGTDKGYRYQKKFLANKLKQKSFSSGQQQELKIE